MILAFHIVIALTSLVYTGYNLFRPSQMGLNMAWGLVFLTLASGTYLIWSTNTSILKGCVSGLVYVILVLCGLLIARHNLIRNKFNV